MFIQVVAGIIGTGIMFLLLCFIVKIGTSIFFPEEVKSMREKEVIKLKENKCELEAKIMTAECMTEEIAVRKKLIAVEKKLNKLKQNLGEMTL